MLRLTETVHAELVAHAYDCFPEEMCGLLGGRPPAGGPDHVVAHAEVFYPTRNAAESSRVYTVDPKDHLRADRDAEDRGLQLLGVAHSHTHTAAYPSPTDVEQAPDPSWHYVIVSLADDVPSLRSYRIVDGKIAEEEVVVVRR